MAFREGHGHASLRRGRHSAAHGTYFLTLCTEERKPILALDDVRDVLFGELDNLQTDEIWNERCAVIMPDHIHIFIELGERITLSQSIGRLKAKSRQALLTANSKWQANFFDHRVDPDEGVLPIFSYIYNNPRRAGLTEAENWPGWRCHPQDWLWFSEFTGKEVKSPSWLTGT